MTDGRGRATIEARFGPLGCGTQLLTIGGDKLGMDELLHRMGLDFDDAKPIDLIAVSENRYALRYYDGQDQRIVAHEFDAEMRFLEETRAHVAEWIGEEAYFSLFGGH
ncbi:MAG: hypothetical protein LAO06_06235 [Acidobacteriia bacterium]|nr:hypothetical protein [Terriglobia bacterium]